MSSVVREIEDRYNVDDDARLPPLVGLPHICHVDDPQTRHLQATYYDTPHLDLLAAGITLLRRTRGPDAGWYLTLPGTEAQHEMQLPEAHSHGVVPPELVEIVHGVVRDQPLVAVAHIMTRRTATCLRDEDARVVAEVRDDRVQASTPLPDQEPATRSWREGEVELGRPCPVVAQEAARALTTAGASPARERTRLERMLTIDSTGSALVEGQLAPTKDSPCAEVLHPYLVRQLALMRRLDPLVRADVPDAVHQMRVVCRRLRSVFGTYRGLFESAKTDPLRRDLKWLVDELGRPRDAEVLRMHIRTMLETDENPLSDARRKSWLEAQLAAEHREAHRRATHAMVEPRYLALLDTLQSTVDDPPWTARAAESARRELPAAIRKDWHRLRKAAKAADRATNPTDRASRLHDVRKAAKRARYSAEAIEPVFGRDAARFALALAGLQTVLGDHHDDVVASHKLLDLAGIAAHEPDAFGFADLAARLDETRPTHEAHYRTALSHISRSNRLRWLKQPASSSHRSGSRNHSSG